MLTGKKFPHNVRALCMLVEGLLCPGSEENPYLNTTEDLLHILDDLSSNSKTVYLWIDCIQISVFKVMKYIRGE